MRLDMDKIVIESRQEIDLLQSALQIDKEHSKADVKKAAEQACELLESMWYSW